MITPPKLTRRRFIAHSASAAAAFNILPGRVLGVGGQEAANDTLSHAFIGTGGISHAHFGYVNGTQDRIVALCDVDENRLNGMAKKCRDAGHTPQLYHDFRKLLEQADIDIVHICTPPHWHALMSIWAAEAGKDIWCEKPMSRTIGEGQAVIDAVKRHGRMFRINTWFRLGDNNYYGYGSSRQIRKLVANKLLGWPVKVRLSRAAGINWKARAWMGRLDLQPQRVPDHFDWDLWRGPAPDKPYHPHRTHGSFRGYWDYDGGGLADMGQHFCDPIQYFLDKDDEFPVEVEAKTPYPAHPEAVRMWESVNMRYADGCEIVFESELAPASEEMPIIEGPKGAIYKGFRLTPDSLHDELARVPDPEPQVSDFRHSVKTRERFGLNEDSSHHSCTIINIANIAIRTGRKLRFNPETQLFVNDEQANRLVHQPMRAPWSI